MDYLSQKMTTLGTAACPPYHLVFVIGGTSAEANLKTVKLASTKYLDNCPPPATNTVARFGTWNWKPDLLESAQQCGIGAQFGGKYFALDVRVMRLAAPRRLAAHRHGRFLQRGSAGQG